MRSKVQTKGVWGVTVLLVGSLVSGEVFAQDDTDFDDLFGDAETSTPANTQQETQQSPAASETNEQALRVISVGEDDDETVRAAPRRRVLEEIVVTAQKREQSLVDVPISVSAISGEKLRDAGIENLSDLSEYAPNFKLVEGGLVPLIYMRGVGSGSNQGFEMSVGLFNDGIHLGRPHQTLAAFLDVERIEVLKGPQSILFGKNAIAGAMNITSGRPTDELDGSVGVSWFEPFQERELSGFVSGPFGDTLRGRFAFRVRDEGGYVYNISQERTDPALDELAARGTLAWDASDTLAFTLKLEHSGRESTGRTYQVIDRGILNESEDTPYGLNDQRDTNVDEFMNLDSNSLTLNSKLDFGEHSLEFVTGYGGYDQADLFDGDSSRIDTVFLLGQEKYSQFSQEVRWVSPASESFEYIFGAFYQQAKQNFNEFGELNVRSGTAELVVVPADLIDLLVLAGPANTVVLIMADLQREFLVDSASA